MSMTINLDEQDLLLVENHMLKVRLEELTERYEQLVRQNNRRELEQSLNSVQDKLAKKYNVDLDTHKLNVDIENRTLRVAELDVDADDERG